jgi:Xaa-Pro aminopeptidase
MNFNVVDFASRIPPIDLSTKIPVAEYEQRIDRIRGELHSRQIDIGFAFSTELKPGDTGWLSGYDPHLEDAACIVGPRAVFILGGPEGAPYAEEMKKVGEFRNLFELKIPEEDYPGATFFTLAELFEEACGSKPKRIGLLSLDSFLPVGMLELIRSSTDAEVVDATDILLKARYIKSKNEQAVMKVAAKISTWAMRALIAAVEPGMRETEAAACADYVMRFLGADGRPGVTTLVNSGDRISNVLGRASNKIIREGESVLLGLSARYEGLSSSISRTITVGQTARDQEELLRHGERAYHLAVQSLGYGMPASGPDLAVHEYLQPLKLHPLYSVVHNIGWTEAMEGYGAATRYSVYVFPKNVTLMVDIGIFGVPFRTIRPRYVGLRMEDPFLINDSGELEKLTDLPIRGT